MKQIEIKFLNEIEIMAVRFTIKYDLQHDSGSFDFRDSSITIGTKSYKKDHLYTLQIISHEIMEIILVSMGGRFGNNRTKDNYLFSFCHQTFENAVQIHTQTLTKFIK